jgi:CheY-like chemotaxis protein
MPSDLNTPDQTPEEEINLRKITAMVVEDEEVIADVICAFLGKMGVRRAISVRNAEDAMYQLEDDDQTKVDIVLVDLMLPGTSGLSLIKTLREHKSKRLRRLPVVVITSYTSMKVYRKAAEFDINGFLRKPVAPGALETAIVKALGGKVSAKAMENYRSEADRLQAESGEKKKPGFLDLLFGGGSNSAKAKQGQGARNKAAAPRRPISRDA